MVKSCCVYGCANRWGTVIDGKRVGFFKIPKANGKFANPDKRREWLAEISRDNWIPHNESVVCGAHFLTGEPHDDPRHPDYKPQIFSYKAVDMAKLKKDETRCNRSVSRTNVKKDKVKKSEAIDALLLLQGCTEENNPSCDDTSSMDPDPGLEFDDRGEEIKALREENNNLNSDLKEAKDQYNKLSEEYKCVRDELEKLKHSYNSVKFARV